MWSSKNLLFKGIMVGVISFIRDIFTNTDDDYIDIYKHRSKINGLNNKTRFEIIKKAYHSDNTNKQKASKIIDAYLSTPNKHIALQKKKNNYKENIAKGKAYEKYIGKHIEIKGFEVDYRGLRLGIKDGGIDLVAIKGDTYILIQCKNWSKQSIKQKDIRVFIGDYYNYIEEHPELKNKKTWAYFYTSSKYDMGAEKYAETKNFLQLKVLGMPIMELA